MLVRKQSATQFLWTSYIISYRKVFNLPRWLLLRWKDVQIPGPESSIWSLGAWNLSNFLAPSFYSGKRPWHDFQSSILDHIISYNFKIFPQKGGIAVQPWPLHPPRGRFAATTTTATTRVCSAYYHSMGNRLTILWWCICTTVHLQKVRVKQYQAFSYYPAFPKFIGTHNTCRCWSTCRAS